MPGQDLIPAPADQIEGLWTETGGMSVSQDLGSVEEYETQVGHLVQVKYAIHCERWQCL